MKNKITLIGMLFCAVAAQAQSQANVTLNVKLNPLMSIQVLHPVVDLEYITEEDYVNNKSITLNDHISTFSTEGYQVKAVYLQSDLETGAIGITPSGSFPHAVYSNIALSSTPQTIITSPVGGGKKRHTVKYSILANMWDREIKTYATQIQYTIMPD